MGKEVMGKKENEMAQEKSVQPEARVCFVG